LEYGYKRDDNNHANDEVDVFVSTRNDLDQVIATKHHGTDPQDATYDVIDGEISIFHVRYACDNGSEGSDDRYEAGEDNRLATITLIERMSFFHILLFEETTVFFMEQPLAHEAACPVTDSVPYDCSHNQGEHENLHIEKPCCRQYSCSEEERVARQEEADK
jgi:hypothetical protein